MHLTLRMGYMLANVKLIIYFFSFCMMADRKDPSLRMARMRDPLVWLAIGCSNDEMDMSSWSICIMEGIYNPEYWLVQSFGWRFAVLLLDTLECCVDTLYIRHSLIMSVNIKLALLHIIININGHTILFVIISDHNWDGLGRSYSAVSLISWVSRVCSILSVPGCLEHLCDKYKINIIVFRI